MVAILAEGCVAKFTGPQGDDSDQRTTHNETTRTVADVHYMYLVSKPSCAITSSHTRFH